MGPDVTVHAFVADGLTPPNADAIYLGQEVVSAAIDQIGWRAPLSVPSPPKFFGSAHSGGSSWWALPTAPPKINGSGKPNTSTHPTVIVPEWGEPHSLDTDELFDTRDLDDFHSTDLSGLTIPPKYRPPQRKRGRSLLPPSPKRKKARRGILSSDTDDSVSSRRKPSWKVTRASTPPIILVPSTLPLPRPRSPPSEDDISDILSIHSIIPLPHHVTSPAPPTPQLESADAVSLPNHPIHLSLMHLVNAPPLRSLSSSTASRPWDAIYSRGAWIVPLVGPALHTAGTPASTVASPAQLPPPLDISSAVVNPTTPATVSPASRAPVEQTRILWTPEALLQFWSLLIRIRKKAVLGPVGFSLEREDLVNLIKNEDPDPLNLDPSSSGGGLIPAHPSGKRHVAAKRAPRREWIKLYCESRYALRLRMILENFRASESFEAPSSSTSSNAKGRSNGGRNLPAATSVAAGDNGLDKRSRKVLLGTRLVFVDDLGHPIIVS